MKQKACGFSRSNFLGTHFTTYDSGESPSHSGFTTDINNARRELVAVTFVCLTSDITVLCCSLIGWLFVLTCRMIPNFYICESNPKYVDIK